MRSESLIRETLEELKGTVTLVIIAHRMSTLSVCDHLVVFDGGRISAAGPAEELLRTNPFLAEATALSRR
jgi:ABC-type multidrug transport system fused ATPase/permease subunit